MAVRKCVKRKLGAKKSNKLRDKQRKESRERERKEEHFSKTCWETKFGCASSDENGGRGGQPRKKEKKGRHSLD